MRWEIQVARKSFEDKQINAQYTDWYHSSKRDKCKVDGGLLESHKNSKWVTQLGESFFLPCLITDVFEGFDNMIANDFNVLDLINKPKKPIQPIYSGKDYQSVKSGNLQIRRP